jgi:hypothetical protein
MAADDPREPRFEPIAQARTAPAEPLRIDPSEIRSEPPPSPPGEAASSLRWLLIGIAAAVVLVVVIIVASRHAATPVAPTSAPTAPSVPTTTATEPAESEAAAQPATAPPATTTTPPPATQPALAPPLPAPAPKASPPPQAAVAPPRSPTPSLAPTVRAPSKASANLSASSAAAVSTHGPKHRRRGPSAAAPWLVQVGAFKSPKAAQAVVERLVKDGWSARSANGLGGWTVAEVTGYRTREEAAHAAKLLTAKAHVPTLVRHVAIEPKAARSETSPPAATQHHTRRAPPQ